MFTSKCASRHDGVHFFDISTSKSRPRLRCFVHFDLQTCFSPQQRAIFHFSSAFSQPNFCPSGATKPWTKHSVSRLFYFLAHLHLLFSDFLHLLSSPYFLHVRVSSWLCFFLAVLFICPYCRNLVSKLPSAYIQNILQSISSIQILLERLTPRRTQGNHLYGNHPHRKSGHEARYCVVSWRQTSSEWNLGDVGRWQPQRNPKTLEDEDPV